MLPALLALAVPIAAERVLLTSLESDDSRVRLRATYALARTFDPGDSAATAKLDQILLAGEAPQRAAVVRGIYSRVWPGGLPADRRGRLADLLANPDPGIRQEAVAAIRLLPRSDAVDLFLAEDPIADRRPRPSARGAVQAALWELGDDRGRALLHDLPTNRAGPSVLTEERCRIDIEPCGPGLALAAWLGFDAGRALSHWKDGSRPVSDRARLVVARVEAETGSREAVAVLVNAVHSSPDGGLRLEALDWLLRLPPSPRAEAIDALVSAPWDGDGRLRARAARELAANVTRFGRGDSIADGFTQLFRDLDADVRIEAAVGLFDLCGQTPRACAAARAAAATETDPVVLAVDRAASKGQ